MLFRRLIAFEIARWDSSLELNESRRHGKMTDYSEFLFALAKQDRVNNRYHSLSILF